jgi:hypothetical protein
LSVPLLFLTSATKAASAVACRTRSPLNAPCPSPLSALSPVAASEEPFDLRWFAITVKSIDPDVNVWAIGSRALNHTDSSLTEREAPFGVAFAGLKMIAVVMTSCCAAPGSSAGVRT